MARYLRSTGTRLFDYPRFTEPFRDEIAENADCLARDDRLEIEYIQRKNFQEEDRINAILSQSRIPLGKSTPCLGALPLLAPAHWSSGTSISRISLHKNRLTLPPTHVVRHATDSSDPLTSLRFRNRSERRKRQKLLIRTDDISPSL